MVFINDLNNLENEIKKLTINSNELEEKIISLDKEIILKEDSIKILDTKKDQIEKAINKSEEENTILKERIKNVPPKLFYFNDVKMIPEIQKFFKSLSHSDSLYIINADASWLIPESFFECYGYLEGSPKDEGIKVTALFHFVENRKETIFQFIIQGANRASIEGYFDPIIKSFSTNVPFTYNDKEMEIPENIIFFLQLDDDECTAPPQGKLSEHLKENIKEFEISTFRESLLQQEKAK